MVEHPGVELFVRWPTTHPTRADCGLVAGRANDRREGLAGERSPPGARFAEFRRSEEWDRRVPAVAETVDGDVVSPGADRACGTGTSSDTGELTVCIRPLDPIVVIIVRRVCWRDQLAIGGRGPIVDRRSVDQRSYWVAAVLPGRLLVAGLLHNSLP